MACTDDSNRESKNRGPNRPEMSHAAVFHATEHPARPGYQVRPKRERCSKSANGRQLTGPNNIHSKPRQTGAWVVPTSNFVRSRPKANQSTQRIIPKNTVHLSCRAHRLYPTATSSRKRASSKAQTTNERQSTPATTHRKAEMYSCGKRNRRGRVRKTTRTKSQSSKTRTDDRRRSVVNHQP